MRKKKESPISNHPLPQEILVDLCNAIRIDMHFIKKEKKEMNKQGREKKSFFFVVTNISAIDCLAA